MLSWPMGTVKDAFTVKRHRDTSGDIMSTVWLVKYSGVFNENAKKNNCFSVIPQIHHNITPVSIS